MIKKNKLIIVLIILGITILSSVFVYTNSNKLDEISYLQFLDYLEEGNVDTVYINDDSKFKILLVDGSEFMTDNPRSVDFKEELLMYDIEVIERSNSIENIGLPLFLLATLIILILYIVEIIFY